MSRVPTYVFGFGSLINTMSRARTLGEGRAWPVRVRGVKRGWYAPSRRIRHTALGVVLEDGTTANGVLAEIPDGGLARLDRREAQYARVDLPFESVEPLGPPPPRGRVVTYLPKRVSSPDADHPIIRTYVDVTLSGCLEYGEAFTKEWLVSTERWSHHFEDDRADPRYPHHEAHAPEEVLEVLVRSVERLLGRQAGHD